MQIPVRQPHEQVGVSLARELFPCETERGSQKAEATKTGHQPTASGSLEDEAKLLAVLTTPRCTAQGLCENGFAGAPGTSSGAIPDCHPCFLFSMQGDGATTVTSHFIQHMLLCAPALHRMGSDDKPAIM